MKNNQQGVGAVGVIVLLVVVGLIVFGAWWYLNSQNETDDQTTPAPTTQEDQVPEIEEEGDLQNTEEFLEDTDVDQELDTSEIDAVLTE